MAEQAVCYSTLLRSKFCVQSLRLFAQVLKKQVLCAKSQVVCSSNLGVIENTRSVKVYPYKGILSNGWDNSSTVTKILHR